MKEKIKKFYNAVKKFFKTAYSIYYAIIMILAILVIDTIVIGGPIALIVYYFLLRQPCDL